MRDYRLAGGSLGRLGSSSPFNIKVESLTLRDFSRDDLAELYGQHTLEGGHPFTEGAIDRAFTLTQGQPWLANALARQLVEVVVTDPTIAIEASHVDAARDLLIRRNDTHLDSLSERLREPRVRRVLEPMLAGTTLGDLPRDDIGYVLDLGLVRETTDGGLIVANPIYQEIIPRVLTTVPRASLPQIAPTWVEGGRVNFEQLLDAFLSFWRRHGEPLLGAAPYHEIAPHLVLLAFLDRVANGGGRVEREYAIGRGRMDICVVWRDQLLPIEVKVWHPGGRDPLAEGLEQLDGYLAGLGTQYGWLVLFDRRPNLPPIADRLHSVVQRTGAGRSVVVGEELPEEL